MTGIDTLIPGEPFVANKPWLRRLGSKVIRFVRPEIENRLPSVVLGRAVDNTHKGKVLKVALRGVQSRLTEEVGHLAECGIDVGEVDVDVASVPIFNKGKAIKLQPGIRVTTDYVSGVRLDHCVLGPDAADEIMPEAARLFERITQYVISSVSDGRPFLSDIMRGDQFMVGETGIRLIDLDPIFTEPNDESITWALDRVEKGMDYLTVMHQASAKHPQDRVLTYQPCNPTK